MKKKIIIGSSLAALLMAGGIAIAAPGGVIDRTATVTKAEVIAKADARFVAKDIDKDGKLTPADRSAAQKARADARFATMDADKSGQITRAEFDAAGDKRMEMRGARGDGERGPGHWGRGGGKGGHHGMMGKGHGRGPGGMMAVDADKDGAITLAEQRAHAVATFDKQDANKDGKVTPDERKAAHEAMRAEWKAQRAQEKGE
ncbi:EF-hand domain-containing protein [Sphingobium boeckii]|uniref:EF-hand domain-containing protein n=1 Tax=Sphingobium boeckii TaxID=1082345 RepID=A0A7W9AJ53_9SPHN|nr:calcium-binding protein [Sphingobium boeckii]MBB5686533.1 hypothetical protein [Sphingobium boeckii]